MLRDVAQVALTAALLTAAAHVAILDIRLHVFGRLVTTWREFVWMAPIAYAVCFLLLAVPIAVVGLFAPRQVNMPRLIGVYGGVGAYGLLLLYREIHPLAFVPVAMGIGYQLTRRAAADGGRLLRGATRVAAICAVGLAALAAARTFAPRMAEARAIAAERAAPADAPNVLLLILDTVRALNVGAYGYARPTTPFIDGLAREGVMFEHAFSTAPWTLPSHASILTGRWAAETGASYLTPLDPDLPTLPDVLGAAGYLTAGFAANAGWAGLEVGIGRDFQRYETHRLDWRQFLWSTSFTQTSFGQELIGGLASGDPQRILGAIRSFDLRTLDPRRPRLMRANEVAERFLQWRERIGDAHPYFAMLNFFDAHSPYRSPPAFERRFDEGATRLDRYDGAIAYIDSVIGSVIAELEHHGELDRTIVIVTSDHGEMFGEHGLQEHGKWLYRPVLHVPLVVRYPRRLDGDMRRAELVSLRDLPATILDLVGTKDTGGIEGESLFAPGREEAPALLQLHASRSINTPPELPSTRGDLFGLLTDRWHYIRYPDGSEDLFEWRRDTAEAHDVSDSTWARAVIATLRAQLDDGLVSTGR